MRVAAEIPSRDRPGAVAPVPLPGWLLLLTVVWMVVVAAVYYRRAWAILIGGPGGSARPELGQSLLSTGLPFAEEAIERAAGAIAGATVVIVANLGAGRALDRWLLPPSLRPAEQWAVRFANGAGVWYLAFFGLALCSLYRPSIVRGVMLLAAGAAAAAALARRRPRLRLPGVDFRRLTGWDRLWSLLVVAASAAAFLTALTPEIEYDALWYHLELPRRWLAAGRPVDDLTEYISLYPLTWDLLFGGALSFDGAPAAKLLHWAAYVASGIVAASIADRALGVKSRPLVAGVFMTAPTVLWEATTAYVDLAVALHVGIGVGALWMNALDTDRRWRWLAGVHLGLACATKHLALVPAAIALLLLFAHAWRAGRLRTGARDVLLIGCLTLAIPSPWYIRSLAASGNPVFPEMYTVFGAAPPQRWDHDTERGLGGFKAHFGGDRTASGLAMLPWDLTMHSWKYGGTLGPLSLLLAPTVIATCIGSAAARWLALGLLLYLLAWASPVSSFQLRFLVPWWLLASAIVALASERLIARAAHHARWWSVAAPVMLAAVLAVNLPPFTPLHEGDRTGWHRWLTHVVRRVPIEVVAGGVSADQWLRREVRTYGAWNYLNAESPKDARVLTFFGGDHFYSQRPRLWSEAAIARPVTWGATDLPLQTLLRRLDALGISHVMAPPPHHQTAKHKALSILQMGTLTAAFDRVYQDEWTIVYRRRPGVAAEKSSNPAASGAGTTDHR
jgi:hypothetical protein